MNKYTRKYIFALILFLLLGAGVLITSKIIYTSDSGSRNTLINRFVHSLEQDLSEDTEDIEDIDGKIDELIRENKDSWRREFKDENIPTGIEFIPIEGDLKGSISSDGDNKVIWAVTGEGRTIGLIVFNFEDTRPLRAILLSEAVVAAAFVVLIAYFVYIDRKLLMPFNRLSSYPEKIARNETGEHIPETREKFFGKYVWGMNMLSDRLKGDRNKLRSLEKEKQTMISTIAHGIKTPVSNIRLYSEAIRSGLYKKDGIPDPEDAVVADKIEKNAQDIEMLVKELVESASQGVVEFEPQIEAFYLSEIEEWVKDEYSNRLHVLKIPFEVDCKSKVMIRSDRAGIIRILTQFMENAVKYGDGKKIGVTIDKTDDGYFLAVSNTGSRVPEAEERYVFNSFWRGSNAEDIEGNGLGLYEAGFIARKLGGTVATRYIEESKETEFSVFFPI
ncbi:MAG: HAMP domain-containing histidine kinase [Saccharofermentans sp.]|nr:HAMP domain-containing histidine kinase [Saccharofermentans sp.]